LSLGNRVLNLENKSPICHVVRQPSYTKILVDK
jgi:hypothetical protein